MEPTLSQSGEQEMLLMPMSAELPVVSSAIFVEHEYNHGGLCVWGEFGRSVVLQVITHFMSGSLFIVYKSKFSSINIRGMFRTRGYK